MRPLYPTAAAVFAISIASAAEPFLSPVFTDNMVLQRDQQDAVWGWTQAGSTVKVSIAGKTAEAKAGADGKWLATLPALPAGGPYTLSVEGPESVTLKDVLVGDVWICSGQSNMEWVLSNSNNAQTEIAEANFPQIRHLLIPHVTSADPKASFSSDGWQVCSPKTAGSFTAVGYFFGRELHKELGVPIGLLHTSWGGTIAEAWTSKEALTPLQDFNQAMEDLERQSKSSSGEAALQEEWYAKNDPDAKKWSAAEFADSSWPEMTQPAAWSGSNVAELANFDGVAWFRRSVDIPAAAAGKEAVLNLGPIDDEDTAWVNGRQVGATDGFMKGRSYKIPAGVLKAGANSIAVRVLDINGNGGFTGSPDSMKLTMDGQSPVSLAGAWHYKTSADLQKVPAFPKRMGQNPNIPTVLYNSMISPLLPFGIKGAIWYQGESNASRAAQYRTLLPAMIGDWRKRFGQGDFPFYIVQLANFTKILPEPGESEWAELREAQSLTAKKVPHSGIATIIDIGEANDIHPRNKQDVGKRLALQALAKTYGKQVVAAGPEFKEAKVEGSAMRLSFDSIGGGLVAKSGELASFAIAGEDKKFVWADAKIDGNTVVVSSPQVSAPVAVRYAWASNPVATLFNKEGLPAEPFRTDNWPGITEGKK
ncbi:sialate O-acetylesterase [Haloferula sp. BvORR071]|uniref:sialate O-acetylesterase n=1 Tax=Haloferula sp. BvORR071 TaxID=1396141 RepID=UPI000554C869|nr:sialate O-acetylesterase [Haloferula sp. BvORR071]